MLFVVTLLLTLIMLFVCIVAYDNEYLTIWAISLVATILLAIASIIMAIIMFVNHAGTNGVIRQNEQRYNALVYQLEHDVYDNDNDIGKAELYNQAREWNEDLAWSKEMQRDFWLGIFVPDIYDDFNFIEYKGE